MPVPLAKCAKSRVARNPNHSSSEGRIRGPQTWNTELSREILQELIEEGTEAFRKVLEKLFNLAMGVERSEFLGAGPYERTSQRRGHANGYKDKKISTRVGELRLKIPQVRGLSFYPQSLEKGCHWEKALKLAIAEMYVHGRLHAQGFSEITEHSG